MGISSLFVRVASVIFVVALLTVGCTTSPETSPEDHIRSLVTDLPDIFDPTSFYLDYTPIEVETDTVTPSLSYEKRSFWREATSSEWQIDPVINEGGQTADVEVVYEFEGMFHIQIEDTAGTRDITKIIFDVIRQYAQVEKTNSNEYGGWQLTAISGPRLSSIILPIPIDSIVVMSESVGSITRTDIRDVYPYDPWFFTFAPEEPVTIRAYTQPDGIVVFHKPWMENPSDKRVLMEFIKVGEMNYYFDVNYTTPSEEGWYLAFIDVIDYSSVWDDGYSYRNRAWGIPYRVEESS
jgi:hypothetical protein